MKVLIIGLGSIGKKHLESLLVIDEKIEIFALRHQPTAKTVPGVRNIFKLDKVPKDIDFAILANPSGEHAKTIRALLHLSIPLFIEKPLFTTVKNNEELICLIQAQKLTTYIACNLRFHPVIGYLKKIFEERKPIEMTVYCGSYLPDWRPEQDYRKNYSAIKALGGGVNLDLIHEIDYTMYLLGSPKGSTGYIAKKSALEIDTADIAHYLLDYEETTAFITLNYYRKKPQRTIELVWEDAIWQVNLLTSRIIDEEGKLVFQADFQMQDTYTAQLEYFMECLNKGVKPMNDIEEAFQTLKITLNE